MNRFFCLLSGLVWVVLSVPVGAQPAQTEAEARALNLVKSLPADLLQLINRSPGSFEVRVSDMIASFGAAKGLQPAGIEQVILTDRARVRAREVSRFVRADLDGDGVVTRAEIDALIAMSSQGARGRLDVNWRRADADQDGQVQAAELASFASDMAAEKVSDAVINRYRALMALDLSGDGFLTVDEVNNAVEMVQSVDPALLPKAKGDDPAQGKSADAGQGKSG
ncbi:MAG: hypothetical protein WAT77_01660 [Paracoccaceae bacterium]